jgi:hypothetical protein
MLYGRYEFQCSLTSKAYLPPFKGSTFRGAFGSSLKRVSCVLRHQECAACLLKERCLYSYVFETHLSDEVKRQTRHGSTPHPFLLEPPPTEEREFGPGDSFEMSMTLFGEVNRQLPYLVHTVERMGEAGLGRRDRGSGKFRLLRVLNRGQAIFEAEEGRLRNVDASEEIAPEALCPAPEQGSEAQGVIRMKVTLATPLRLKRDNRLADRLPFQLLVRAALRRVSELFAAFGGGEPALDYPGLVRGAGSVRTVHSTVEWKDWRRFSNRQKTGMALGGMLGEAVYEGRLGPFLPLLEMAGRFNLGKQTSFGLGKIVPQKLAEKGSKVDSQNRQTAL